MSKLERIAASHRERQDRMYAQQSPKRGDALSFRLKGRQMPKGFSAGIIGFMVRYKGVV